jgi:hypothetical protein
MGLRFSCVAGWGWVAEIGACIAGCVHPLEKSAADFVDTSIHRLASRKKNPIKFGSLRLRKRSS